MNLIKVYMIAWILGNAGVGRSGEVGKCLQSCEPFCDWGDTVEKELTKTESLKDVHSECYTICLIYKRLPEKVQNGDMMSLLCLRLLSQFHSGLNHSMIDSKECPCLLLTCSCAVLMSLFTIESKEEGGIDYSKINQDGSTVSKATTIFPTDNLTWSSEEISYPNLPTSQALSETDDVYPARFDDLISMMENVSIVISSQEISSVKSVSFGGKLSVISDVKFTKETISSSITTTDVSMENFHKIDLKIDSFDPRRWKPELNSSFQDVYELFRSRYPVEEWKSKGFFTEDYFHLINSHWMQFEPPYHSSHYILAALYLVISIIGCTGNCLVIFMFLRCRSLRTPATVLVMNLAVSDFFLLIKNPVFVYNSIHYGPVLGALGCEVYGFLGGLTGVVSIMTLAAIALDRYYVIVYPLERRTTRQRARICVILVWCYGILFASLPLTGYGLSRYVPEGYLTSCGFDYLNQATMNRVFILVFFFAAWVVPCTIITFCYCKIYRVVISESSGASSRRGQEQEKRKTEIRLASVVVGAFGLWFFAWTPYAIVSLLGVSGYARLITPLTSMIPALFCKAASCVDPYLYAVTHPRFRSEFRKFFCKRRKRKLETAAGRTQIWKTGASQIPGMMIRIPRRRADDSFSEEDIEEMVVMVDNRLQSRACFSSPTVAPEAHGMCDITFPLDAKTNQRLKHPSWFASPCHRRDRSTSLKPKRKRSGRSLHADPITV